MSTGREFEISRRDLHRAKDARKFQLQAIENVVKMIDLHHSLHPDAWTDDEENSLIADFSSLEIFVSAAIFSGREVQRATAEYELFMDALRLMVDPESLDRPLELAEAANYYDEVARLANRVTSYQLIKHGRQLVHKKSVIIS